jgi:hypothetical protein
MELENKDMANKLPVTENNSVQDESVQDQELLVEDSLELNRQRKSLSPEEYEKFLESLTKANKKIIPVKPLSMSDVALVEEVLVCLVELKGEVLQKRDESVRQSQFIKDKVSTLVVSGKVQIHQDEYKKSEESVLQYAGLLDNIVTEIDSEISYFSLFIAKEMPGSVVAWMSEPDDFIVYIKEKVKFIKKYVKSIRKDLNISFSRYNFGFQAQIKRILQVEAYVKYQEHMNAQGGGVSPE